MRTKILLSFLLHVAPALCQFALEPEMKADVSFGEANDRFDLTDLVQEQKQFEQYLAKNRRHKFKEGKKDIEGPLDSSEDEARRSFRYPGKLFARRWDGGFSYHDDMRSDIGGSLDDFEKALDDYRNKNARRYDTSAINYIQKMLKNDFRRRRRRDYDQVLRYEIPQGLKITAFQRE